VTVSSESLRRTPLPDGHAWLRVAKPEWQDPCDPTHAARHGGRWNPPRSWPTLYLNRDVETARAQVVRLLEGTFATPDDLADDAFVLVALTVPGCRETVDVVSDEGVRAAGLPSGYPRNRNGSVVGHERCQRIGVRARAEGYDGVLARSAATPDGSGQELACWGGLDTVQRVGRPLPYGRWR
jgi:RES domain-containing protein